MSVNKLFALLLGVVFLFGTTVAAVAQTQQAPAPTKQQEAAKPLAKAKMASGKVKSVSADSLVVEVGKKEITFAVSGEAAESAQKLKAGDRVTVSYTESDGKMTATKVTGKTAKTAKKSAQPCAAQKK